MKFESNILTFALASLFTKATSAQLNSGQFRMCEHPAPKFGRCQTIDIGQHVEKAINILPSFLIDKASSIQYNLPVGVAVTLTDHTPSDYGHVHNAGASIDLIGTGSFVELPFRSNTGLDVAHVDDLLAAWTWFRYDVELGFVELWEHPNYVGICQVLSLSEFPMEAIQSIVGWHDENRVTSMRYNTLADTVTLTLYEHVGAGHSMTVRRSQVSDVDEIPDLRQYLLDDQISSFNWGLVNAKKVEIEDILIEVPANLPDGNSYTAFDSAINNSPSESTLTLSIIESNAQTTMTTVSKSSTHGGSITVEFTYSPPGDIGGFGGRVSTTFYESLTTTREDTFEETRSSDIELTRDVTIPANHSLEATFEVTMGELPPISKTVKVTRWYDFPIVGGIQDNTNNGWYKREESFFFTIEGGLAYRTTLVVNAEPLN